MTTDTNATTVAPNATTPSNLTAQKYSYEEHFVAFIDFLGFAEAIDSTDDNRRTRLLDLLIGLSQLQGDFNVEVKPTESGTITRVIPNISTFSDNIVISYPLEKLRAIGQYSDDKPPFFIIHAFTQLVSRIAAAALQLGFLIRGGATIGKLYHSKNVVYGEAMVEAYRIESRVSNYPRIVMSSRITHRPNWKGQFRILTDHDGLKHLDYFSDLVLGSVEPGDTYTKNVQAVYAAFTQTINSNLNGLKASGSLQAYAKWAYFAEQVRRSLDGIPVQALEAFGIDKAMIPSLPS